VCSIDFAKRNNMTIARNMIANTNSAPRVFLSYARTDGEQFAAELRQRLQDEHIPLWQDRVGLEGGKDWWLQIAEALDVVEFLVLVMTPAAMISETVRKEWRYARQQGVCVYPVKGVPDLDFAILPHWMRSAHFYDPDHEWQKLVNDLYTRCQRVRVPFMVEDLPPDYVPRPQEFDALVEKLLDQQREEPIAITAALRGAGGYGKTTIANALCHDERIQQAFDDGILWVTLGENPGNLVGKVEDLIETLSGKRPGFTDTAAAAARLAELLAERDILLVVDDVWDSTHLKPFLQGGKHSARLVTTRNEDVLPANAQSLVVDAMHPGEAMQLLSSGLHTEALTATEQQALSALVARLGEWALLLKLANGVLRDRVGRGETLAKALTYLNKALDKRGLTAFDAANAQARDAAVSATLRVSFDLLQAEQYARYQELAIFPEDVAIPLATLEKLWATTGGLDDFDTEELCQTLYRHSLLLTFDLTTRTIRLHDVIRSYLQKEAGDKLSTLHEHLLDAYNLTRWADLPADEPYLWDYLAEHLFAAGRLAELVTTVRDLRYLARKTLVRTAYATEADLAFAEQRAPDDVPLRLLTRNVANMGHMLNRCNSLNETAPFLYSRLMHLQELFELCQAFEQHIPRPYLTSWHMLPDLPDPALIRTLSGHTSEVRGCAISPVGDFIVSASDDNTLKIWDAHTGVELHTLRGHTDEVYECAINRSGDFIVSASKDQTLKVWNARTKEELRTLHGHTDKVRGCAISPAGDIIVSASWDQTLKVWNTYSGEDQRTLRGHTDKIYGCAISPAGDFIVSASDDNTLKIWDTNTGEERFTLRGHTDKVHGCAISLAGDLIVSASFDQTLKVWDARTGKELRTLRGHTDKVHGCAISPAGDYIVSASEDHMLKEWDAHTGEVRRTLRGHTWEVIGCAISPAGDYIVTTSADWKLKVWDTTMGEERLTYSEQTNRVRGCAISPAGDYIVSASRDQTLKMWDVRTGKELRTLHGHTAGVYGCTISPAGDLIVSASFDQTLKVWDVRTGEELRTLHGHTSWVIGCAFSPSGNSIVSVSDDHTLKIWDAHTWTSRLTLIGHTDQVTGCAISPAGDLIVSASKDHTLKVWDARTGEELRTLHGHTDWVYGCTISPAGDFLVSASYDHTLKVWDVRTGDERRTLRGHTGKVHGCAISPAGDSIASASDDETLRMWDMRTGACLSTLYVNGSLYACAFHPDGEHIVAAGDGGVYFLRWVR
jgi:WD40 repeat protein